MRVRKESDLKTSCDSQSNKRLEVYRHRLASDGDPAPIFDDKVLEVARRYARPGILDVEAERAYLNSLKRDDGVSFSRSFKEFSSMQEVWSNYDQTEAPSFRWNRHYRHAVERVMARYSRAHLRPLNYRTGEEIQRTFGSLNTSTGFTSIIDGVRKKRDLSAEELYRVTQEARDYAITNGTFDKYLIAGYRTQGSGEYDEEGNRTYTFKLKTRPIWMVDVSVVANELRFANPMNLWISTYSHSAISKNDQWISRRIGAARRHFSFWMSLDYSKYDSTIPSWLIHSAFDVLNSAFIMTHDDELILRAIEEDFINKNLILPDGVLHVTHGNPSGSGLTSIINGICNEIITETWSIKFGYDTDPIIMGDDNLIFLYNHPTHGLRLDDVITYIKHNFGIIVNEDKSRCGLTSKAPNFLSRTWTSDGPYRHPKILLSKMLFPERWRNYSDPDFPVTPEQVFYSYILGYRKGMMEAFDIERFLMDTNLSRRRIGPDSPEFEHLPYNVRSAMTLGIA